MHLINQWCHSQLVYSAFLYGGPVDRTTASMMYWNIEHWNSRVFSEHTILSLLLGTSGLYLCTMFKNITYYLNCKTNYSDYI